MNLTFSFKLDYNDRTWTVTCNEAPELVGIELDPYEALLDCAYSLFNKAEYPEDVEKRYQKQYHQLNLEFFPFFPGDEPEEVEMDDRVLSPEQQERAKRFNFGDVR